MKIYLICILLNLSILTQVKLMAQEEKSYEYIEKQNLFQLLEKEGLKREEYQQIKFNYAYYYQLKDGRVVIDPAIGKTGLIVKDEQAFNAMVEAKWFPVPDDGSFFAPERHQIEKIQKDISLYSDRLKQFCVIDIESIEDRVEALKKLNRGFHTIIKNSIREKVDDKTLVALGVYLGEILRREVKGKWKFDEESTLNPYLVPYLEVDGREAAVDIWGELSSHLDKRKKADFNYLYNKMLARIKKQQSYFK